jgi:hypothetical protein
MPSGEERSAPFFYGLQPRWLSWDRLYRVYVSDKGLRGAYIAGQCYDERSAMIQLQQMHLLFRPLVRRWLQQRQERESLYDSVNAFGPSMLQLDWRNFHIARADVMRTRFRRNRSLWTPFNVGTVELELLDGITQRLILAGEQESDTVLSLMQRFDPGIEVTGKSKPMPRPRTPKSISPAGKRRYYLLMASLLLGFGTLFAYAALAGVARNPIFYLVMAAVNALAGGWCLVRAWMVCGTPEPDDDLLPTSIREGEVP